jgi:hypothetical protein
MQEENPNQTMLAVSLKPEAEPRRRLSAKAARGVSADGSVLTDAEIEAAEEEAAAWARRANAC